MRVTPLLPPSLFNPSGKTLYCLSLFLKIFFTITKKTNTILGFLFSSSFFFSSLLHNHISFVITSFCSFYSFLFKQF
eukprot:UN04459